MSRYNRHFANHFSSCRLLAYAYDPHRQRDVKLYMIPGEVEVVGVHDGVDSWIAPALNELFSVDVKTLMRAIFDGKDVEVVGKPSAGSRTRVTLVEVGKPRTRISIEDVAKPRSRRALLA